MPETGKSASERETAAGETERSEEASRGTALTAEERRQNRERIGGAAVEKYLGVQEGDEPATRQLKERLGGLDLEESIGTLLDTKSPQAIRDALDQMGITRDRSGKWRLRNPEPGLAETLPGSYAAEEHLKAFMAGFVEAKSLRDQVAVVREVYEYLGLEPPELDELLPEEPAGARPEPAAIPKPEQAPLSKWKSVFDRLRRHARSVSLAVGLVTIFGVIGTERSQVVDDVAEPPGIELVEKAPGVEAAEDEPAPAAVEAAAETEQGAFRVMRKGDTVDGIVRSMLGEHARDKSLAREMVKKVLEDNSISDRWYHTEGHFDSTKLPVGTRLDVTAVAKKLGELRQIQEVRQDLDQMR